MRIGPAERVGLLTDGERHERLPRGVKIDPVDPITDDLRAGKFLELIGADRAACRRGLAQSASKIFTTNRKTGSGS
jgi:hypothetical protein